MAALQGMGVSEGGSETKTPLFLEGNSTLWRPFVTMPGGKSTIFQLASLLQTLPMRPVSLDTAQQFIAAPDVMHRCPATEAAAQEASVVLGFRRLFGFK
jgi:hypothetical protein